MSIQDFTQYQTRVPLIFYAPGREPRRFEHRTSHIDITPTLLHEYLGCTNDISDYSNGRILFDDNAGSHPLAIGSYFNHAFVINNGVYENRPMHMKKYTLDDVNGDAGPPQREASRVLAGELTRFMDW